MASPDTVAFERTAGRFRRHGGGADVSDTYHDYLRSVPLFADLDSEELNSISGAVTDVSMPAGRQIIQQGTSAREMVIVVDGTLEVTRDGTHIADIGPGGFAGEMALLSQGRRNATVAAKTDVSLLHIDGRDFWSLLERVPELSLKMLAVVAERVAANEEHH
jgi:CRP-like cAMP-binding protein